jgi:hypothetical protein
MRDARTIFSYVYECWHQVYSEGDAMVVKQFFVLASFLSALLEQVKAKRFLEGYASINNVEKI